MLLKKLISKDEPIEANIERDNIIKPIQTRPMPWVMERQRLEAESRRKAAEIQQNVEKELKAPPLTSIPLTTVEELEEKMDIKDASGT